MSRRYPSDVTSGGSTRQTAAAGWRGVTSFSPSPGRPAAVLQACLLALAAALLAGVQPARRFARMRPVDALREA